MPWVVSRQEADVLAVAKLDRLTRSVGDLTALLDWTTRGQVGLVALDPDVDTTTPGGRMVVQVFATVAEWERGIISERTRNALSMLRAQGKAVSRPSLEQTRPQLAAPIVAMRERGMTLQAIADALNAEGVPTGRGGAH
jgi:DNA invertase Pin-like site-specific DNA recombinase